VLYTLNDYGRYRLSPAWLSQEFEYLKTYLTEAAKKNDPEVLDEFIDTLRALRLSEQDALIRAGVEYHFQGERLRRPELMAIIQPLGKLLRPVLLPKHAAAGDLFRLRVEFR